MKVLGKGKYLMTHKSTQHPSDMLDLLFDIRDVLIHMHNTKSSLDKDKIIIEEDIPKKEKEK